MKFEKKQWFALLSVLLLAIGAYDCRDLFSTAVWQWQRDPVEGVKGDGPFVDSSRILVRKNVSPGEKVLLWVDDDAFPSIDRTLAEALCWEVEPKCLTLGRDFEASDAVVVGPTRSNKSTSKALEEGGFKLTEDLSGSQIWRRDARDSKRPTIGAVDMRLRPPVWLDVFGIVAFASVLLLGALAGGIGESVGWLVGSAIIAFLALLPHEENADIKSLNIIVFALMGSFFHLIRSGRVRFSLRGIVFSSLFVAIASFLVLGSDLPANFGLGVYGGKAKLWLSSGCGLLLGGNPACDVLQPSYPPAFSLVVCFFDNLVHGCSERCVRLLPPLFLAASLGLLCARARNFMMAFFAFAVFMSFPALMSSTSFCAEPLLILFAVTGIVLVRDGYPKTGFWLIGLCGFAKTEGVLIAIALWCVMVVTDLTRVRIPSKIFCLFFALFPGVAWIVFAAAHGQVPQDYAPLWHPNMERLGYAASEAFRIMLQTPWRHGFVYLVALAVLIAGMLRLKLHDSDIPRELLAFAAFPMVMACLYVYMLSLSLAPDFTWHCQCLERLLLPPAIIVLALVYCSGVKGSGQQIPSPMRQ